MYSHMLPRMPGQQALHGAYIGHRVPLRRQVAHKTRAGGLPAVHVRQAKQGLVQQRQRDQACAAEDTGADVGRLAGLPIPQAMSPGITAHAAPPKGCIRGMYL